MFKRFYKANLDLNLKMVTLILRKNTMFMEFYKNLILMEENKGTSGITLDLGCGSQNHIKFENPSNLIGIDIDLDKLKINPYKKKFVCDAHYIGIKSSSINTILSQDLFEHLFRPELCLKELFRVLKPGGRIIFKIPNKTSIFGFFASNAPYWLHNIIWKITLSNYPDVTPAFYNFNDKKTIQRFSKEAGLLIEKLAYFCGTPPQPVFLPCFIYIPYLLMHKFINTVKGFITFSDVIVGCIKKPDVVQD